jgi:hypothetical protein
MATVSRAPADWHAAALIALHAGWLFYLVVAQLTPEAEVHHVQQPKAAIVADLPRAA